MTRQDFLKSKLATAGLSVVLIFVMILAAKILVQKRAVDKEIAKLENQVGKIKQDNDQLSSLIKYFNTPQYQEKQAREKLNLSKPGEIVVGLPQGDQIASAQASTASKPSNYKLWFDYFFNHD
jgi:cell division protein FtsB